VSDYPPYRIAINHQENVPPKWHHKDGWPRKVIRSRITAESLIHYIIAIRNMNTEERQKAFNKLAECAPNLTVQTVMAVLEERYLYVSGWGPEPDGMIITVPPNTETIIVPTSFHVVARRL
jgi:hypothetical protein